MPEPKIKQTDYLFLSFYIHFYMLGIEWTMNKYWSQFHAHLVCILTRFSGNEFSSFFKIKIQDTRRPPFFTAVYIVERLELQTICVLNEEILQFLGQKSAVYN